MGKRSKSYLLNIFHIWQGEKNGRRFNMQISNKEITIFNTNLEEAGQYCRIRKGAMVSAPTNISEPK